MLAVVVDHVRLHFYDDRYLTLTNLFGPISGILAVFVLVKFVLASWRQAYVQPAFLVAALTLLTLHFPARIYSGEYELLRETALTLSSKAPGGVLMGGYWDTYVFAALQPKNTMIPVPVEGQVVRMPWTQPMVRRANLVVVGYSRGSTGAQVSPAPTLTQYGTTLRLIEPNWIVNHQYSFALYANNHQ